MGHGSCIFVYIYVCQVQAPTNHVPRRSIHLRTKEIDLEVTLQRLKKNVG